MCELVLRVQMVNFCRYKQCLLFCSVKEFPRHLRLPKPKGATDEEDTQLSQRQQLLILRKQKGISVVDIPDCDTTTLNVLTLQVQVI